VLHACPRLRLLNLEGNPVTRAPNYRPQVVVGLPTLRMLDNKVGLLGLVVAVVARSPFWLISVVVSATAAGSDRG